MEIDGTRVLFMALAGSRHPWCADRAGGKRCGLLLIL
jgi:hypothetical protein